MDAPRYADIADGIIFGIVSYAVLKAIAGKAKEVPIVIYCLAAFPVLKFVLGF
ncbi:MAG: hypothetical protein VB032_02925 [Burkholderiaceae bacterium]|nr:hypothetical protein [Burkholderiaceae bacterium]